MYVARIPNRKSPPTFLLRESYREGKDVKTRTLANVTHWTAERIDALKRCLKGEFDHMIGDVEAISDRIFGVLFVLKQVSHRLRISQALGKNRIAKLALFLVLARVAHQGSRLSAVRWAENQAVAEVLGLSKFDEDDLYDALDWLTFNQEKIEKSLFYSYVKQVGHPPVLVLYDVTSSYLEGEKNELSEFGHNRDNKKGKKQIVIGLLTSDDGEPLAVRVFKGNTSDLTTLTSQIEILKKRFRIEQVVFVGDRGMVKKKGKKDLNENGLRYITALTDPQIRKLLKKDVIQIGLFDEAIEEVEHDDIRLVLRRNELIRQKESNRRQDKLKKLSWLIEDRNQFVRGSKSAMADAGLRKFKSWIKKYKLSSFVDIRLEGKALLIDIDEEKKKEVALLDGCYVLESDVAKDKMDATTLDARYRDLQKVERDFRTMKTSLLEVRPIFVRKKNRTIGHVFVAMMALKISREIDRGLKKALGTTEENKGALTVGDALEALSRLCFERLDVAGEQILRLPRPDKKQMKILEALGISPPKNLRRKPAEL